MKELGLGFVLKFTDQTSAEVARVRQHVVGLRSDLEGTTRSFGGNVSQIGAQAANMGNLIKAGFAAFGGAAALMPVRAVVKEALESQRQMRDLTTVMMAQGAPGLVATERVAEAQKRIHEVNRQVPGMLDKMESAAGEMRAAFGDMYLDAFGPIAKLAFVGTQAQDFAAVMNTAAGALYKFRNTLPGKTDLEKLTAVTDAFAKAKAYKLDVAETGNILLRASAAAAVYGADFYDMLAAVAPVVRQTSMPRMAANAVAQTYEALATYSDQVKELKKQPAKKGQAITWGDVLGSNQSESELDKIPKKDRWLLDLKVTNAQGMFLPLADIVDQVTAGAKITKKQAADVDRRVKAGEISGEQAATQGFGIDVETAKWIMKLLGPAFGMYLGHADEMRQARSEFVNSAGLTQSIFEQEVKEAAAQADLLKGQFEGLKDQIGDNLTPALGEFLKAINAAATGLGQWMENNPKTGAAATWIGTGLATAGAGYGVYRGVKYGKGVLGNLGRGASTAAAQATEDLALGNAYKPLTAAERMFERGLLKNYPSTVIAQVPESATLAMMKNLGSGALNLAKLYGPQVALGVLTMYAEQGKSSLSELGLTSSGTPQSFGPPSLEEQRQQQIRYQTGLFNQIFGQPANPGEPSGIAQTVYQTNTFYIDAQGLDADTLKLSLDKTTRSEAERGVTGKN